ncbi:phosphotransferase family protein [Pseudohalioglobus lutimaris]|uniref:phosphotransferase family protein n=1 Tax=Pseudohalioglobus lutimaris TaxID=1737061 RepID=UPI001056D8D3|nr:phosphotransferase family protein [Pseudohalioglobus lutimaris]
MARKEIGDLESIRQKLENWLPEKLPGAAQVHLNELTFPEESGESSVTLLLNAKVDGQPMRFVCRMKPLNNPLFADYDLMLQYRLMEIAGANGVPVPELVAYEPDTTLVGCDFYVMHFTDGLIPSDNPPYAFGSWVTELSAQQRSQMWRNGLEVLAQIHSIDMSAYDTPSLPRSVDGQSILQHEIDKFAAIADDNVATSLAPIVLEGLECVKANAPESGSVRLCWGDARVGNVIWKDLQPAAVIDWEMASLCDPLMDLSWWYWVDYANSVGLGVKRLSGLPDRPELYQQWQALTGLSTENSLYYDLFNVVRFAIILEKKFLEVGLAADMGGEKSYASALVAPLLDEYRLQSQ